MEAPAAEQMDAPNTASVRNAGLGTQHATRHGTLKIWVGIYILCGSLPKKALDAVRFANQVAFIILNLFLGLLST